MASGILCDDPNEHTIHVECLTCKAMFSYEKAPGVRGRKRRYCSSVCKATAVKAHVKRYRAEGRYPPNPNWPSKQPEALARRPWKTYTCEICASQFQSRWHKARFCGPECLHVHQNGAPDRYQAEQKARGLAVECAQCQGSFYRRMANQKFCTPRCLDRSRNIYWGRARRGRYAAGELVDPIKVFERDGWKCQDCRQPTPQRLRGTMDPRAPNLDHIKSLADGGWHSYRNTQLLCFECNMRKGRRSVGQLHLFSQA